jgi:hypothetical protein
MEFAPGNEGARAIRVGAAAADGQRTQRMTETVLAILVLASFVVPVPLLAWLDRKPRRGK